VKWLGAALSVALAACTASGPALRPSATLPAAALASPRSYIVVTVRNPMLETSVRAASTPHGYDSAGPYLAGSLARRAARSLAADYGLEQTSSWPIALLGVHCLVYALPPGADADQVLAKLAHDRRVESAQPLVAFATQSGRYNDPYADLQHNVAQMAIAEAHGLSRGGGVRVAVIDTGVDVDHPDLPAHGTQARNFVDTDGRAFRADVHGTAVAGIIAAVPNNGIGIVGVAPDAQLLAYKACWRAATGTAGVCNTFTLAQALAAAIEAHADIINLSLAGPSDPLLTRIVRHALDAGVIVVGAVAADGLRATFPTDIPGVIAVDTIESGHRDANTIEAPGREILSLAPDGHYDFYSGSSLATAEVSGVIALMRAERPHVTAHEVEALLTQTATTLAVPNACTALAALMHRGPCEAR
jgi:subtilisin family serine protease